MPQYVPIAFHIWTSSIETIYSFPQYHNDLAHF